MHPTNRPANKHDHSPKSLLAAWLALMAPVILAADQSTSPSSRPRLPEPPPSADTSRVTATRPFDRVAAFKRTPQGELKAHIFHPPGWSPADRRPAIVFWVGGGFRSGRIGQFSARADYFASRGLVAVCAEYRGRDTHGVLLDSCAEDARSAMRWVKAHAKELGISPDKVIAAGGSAGGCLSMLVAREQGPDAVADDLSISTRPCAMLLFNPAVGPRVMDTVGWGGPAQEDVNAQIAALDTPQKDEPPAIMFFGTEDRFLIVASEFNRKSHAQGSRCEVWIAEGMGHGFFNNQPWHDATTLKADEFLVSLNYLEGASPLKEDPAARLELTGPDYVPAIAAQRAIQPARKAYDIPAGTLENALQAYAEQSGQSVVIAANASRDVKTAAVRGEFAVPRQPLDRILAGTGLKATLDRTTGTWVISRVDSPVDARAEVERTQGGGLRR